MNSFQSFTRNEIDYLKSKIRTLENSVEDIGPEMQRSKNFTP